MELVDIGEGHAASVVQVHDLFSQVTIFVAAHETAVSTMEVDGVGSSSTGASLTPTLTSVDIEAVAGAAPVIVRDSDTDQLAHSIGKLIGRAKYFIVSSNSYKSNISSPLQNSMHATSNLFPVQPQSTPFFTSIQKPLQNYYVLIEYVCYRLRVSLPFFFPFFLSLGNSSFVSLSWSAMMLSM